MKNSNLKLISWIIPLCMVFSVMGCMTLGDSGIELNPQGDPSPFEGLWEMEVDFPQSLKDYERYKNREQYTQQLMFHLNTWELRSDINESGIISPFSNGTFTYTENTITKVTVNLFLGDRKISAKSLFKRNSEVYFELVVYGVPYGYVLSGDALLLITSVMYGEEQRMFYKKVK